MNLGIGIVCDVSQYCTVCEEGSVLIFDCCGIRNSLLPPHSSTFRPCTRAKRIGLESFDVGLSQ